MRGYLVLLFIIVIFGSAQVAKAQEYGHQGGCSSGGNGHHGYGDKLFKKFDKMDLNGDGSISLDELRAIKTVKFLKADSDSDGFISGDEFSRGHGAMGKGCAKRHGSYEGSKHRGDGRSKHLLHADSDGDGRVSRQELETMIETHFAKNDANDDGRLSWAEFKAAHKKMKEMMGMKEGTDQ